MSAADQDYEKGVQKMLELAVKHSLNADPKALRSAFDMGARWGVVCIINEMDRSGAMPREIVDLMRSAAAAAVRDGMSGTPAQKAKS